MRDNFLGYTLLPDPRRHWAFVRHRHPAGEVGLLRRTRSAVMKDLPPRTTEIVRIAPTAKQLDIDQAQMQIVSAIDRKNYISEMDLLRLQKAGRSSSCWRRNATIGSGRMRQGLDSSLTCAAAAPQDVVARKLDFERP